jgi:hypothetical protein
VRPVGSVNFTIHTTAPPTTSVARVVVSLKLQVVGGKNQSLKYFDSKTATASSTHGAVAEGDAWEVDNSWELSLFPSVAPIHCATPIFAPESLLSAVRQVCNNAALLPTSGNFTPPARGPFVAIVNKLESDVAAAVAEAGGAVLVISPTTGEFPVCASSVIGPVPTPVTVAFEQPFWLAPGTTGTLLYNTSLTRTMAGSAAVDEQMLG